LPILGRQKNSVLIMKKNRQILVQFIQRGRNGLTKLAKLSIHPRLNRVMKLYHLKAISMIAYLTLVDVQRVAIARARARWWKRTRACAINTAFRSIGEPKNFARFAATHLSNTGDAPPPVPPPAEA
jgi:hypothetical protein